MLAAGALLLIATSVAGAGRIAEEARQFQGHTVRLRIWGSEPQQVQDAPIVVKRVWALGAGLHLNAVTRNGSGALHIKVAQPRRSSSRAGVFIVGDAKYVQVSGATVPRVPRAVALEMLLGSRDALQNSSPPRSVRVAPARRARTL